MDRQGKAIADRFNIAIVEENPAFVRRAIEKMNNQMHTQMRLMEAGLSYGDKLVVTFEGETVAGYIHDIVTMGAIVKSVLPTTELSAARDLVSMRFAQLNGKVELLQAELTKQGMPPDVIVSEGNIYSINAEALGYLAKLWNSFIAEARVKSAA